MPEQAQTRCYLINKKAPGVSAAARNSSTMMFSPIPPVGSRKKVPKNGNKPAGVHGLIQPPGSPRREMESGKWLELLKQVAPDVTRAAVLRDPNVGTGTTQFAVIQAMAPLLRVEVNPVDVRDPSEIRRAVKPSHALRMEV